MTHEWIITPEHIGVRLDVFLASKLPNSSRSHIAKLLKAKAGCRNGKTASVHAFLHLNDIITFEDTDKRQTVSHEKSPAPKVKVLDQQKDYIIIDKPEGVLSHPDANTKHGTIVDAALTIDPKIAKVGEDPERPGIVHRLDKDVSGLMVIARTQHGFEHLKKQFAEHSTQKKYIALVYGEIVLDEGDIKFRIARSTTKGRMAARPEHETTGKAAWTHYKVVTRYRNATLLQLEIISGRTHQIRAHMLAMNHPIIGDKVYTRSGLERNVQAPRLMLQCIFLAFNDPATEEKKEYTLPPIPAFASLGKLFS